MIRDGVLILYTSNPACPQLAALVRQLEATGRPVFLRPLTALRQLRKAAIAPTLSATLATLHPN